MTLKRLFIILGILVVAAGVGIMWLWQYAYTPEGRARVIIAQLKGDSDTTLRGWLLQHHLIRPGYQPEWSGPDEQHQEENVAPACDAMVKLGRPAIPVVIESLNDSDKAVLIVAMHTCGKLPDPRAMGPLIALVRDRNRFPQDESVAALWNESFLGIGPAACLPLMDLLEDRDPECRDRAVMALGIIGDKRAADAIFRHVSDADDNVRFQAAESLFWIGDPRATAAMIRLLDDPQSQCRERAALALGRYKGKAATDALLRHISQNVESDPDAKRAAADALCQSRDPKTIPLLLDILKSCTPERSGYRYAYIAGALARMGQEDGRKFLLADMKSSSPTIRVKAVNALLENFFVDGFLDPLLALLSDADKDVRRQAVIALGELRDPRARPGITKLFKDSDPEVRGRAVYSLGKYQDPADIPTVRHFLKDSAPYVRYYAMEALVAIHDPSAIPDIKDRLADPDKTIRLRAAEALEKFGVKVPPASQPADRN